MNRMTYNDAHESKEWTIIEHACGSDYSGSVVSRANFEWLRDNMGHHNDLALLHGQFFTYGIAYRSDTTDTRILQLIDSMEDYFVICDTTLSRVESEKIEEAMSWVMRDFRYEIETMGVDNDDVSDETMKRLFDACVAISGEEWTHDYNEMSIDVQRVARAFPACIESFPVLAEQSIKY